MGYLLEGRWKDGWYDTGRTGGDFVRPQAQFRNRVTADGSSGYPAVYGRYHLYVSLACPWAHRTLIMRRLKGLEDAISVSVVEPVLSAEGWAFSGELPDHLHGCSYLHQLYTMTQRAYSGRVTVPALWDKRTGRIVNNESAEIIRMLDGCSLPSTRWKDGFPAHATWSAARRPRRTGGCSRPCCGSTPCSTGISSATCGASRTIPTCPATCAICTRRRGSPPR